MNSDEAFNLAMEWATGRRSHHNAVFDEARYSESSFSPTAMVAMADSATVQMWIAVAREMRERESQYGVKIVEGPAESDLRLPRFVGDPTTRCPHCENNGGETRRCVLMAGHPSGHVMGADG